MVLVVQRIPCTEKKTLLKKEEFIGRASSVSITGIQRK
jgi:hypothetical protein